MLPLGHGELVDGQPVVVGGSIEVDHPGLSSPNASVRGAVLNSDSTHQHSVERAVTTLRRRALSVRQLPVRIGDRIARQLRTQSL